MEEDFSKGLSLKWYVIKTRSGCEKKVIQAIEHSLNIRDMRDLVKSLMIPTEEVIEVKRGKKNVVEKKIFSNYVFIEANMTQPLIGLITKTKEVMQILGDGDSPAPLLQGELEHVHDQMRNGTIANRKKLKFTLGDHVTVNDGPFHSFSGSIEDIDEERQRLKVLVTIFGRATPVDLSFTQATKDD